MMSKKKMKPLQPKKAEATEQKKSVAICFVCKEPITNSAYGVLPKSVKYPVRLFYHNRCSCFSDNWNEMNSESPLVQLYLQSKADSRAKALGSVDANKMKSVLGLVKYVSHMLKKKDFEVNFSFSCDLDDGHVAIIKGEGRKEPFIVINKEVMPLHDFLNLNQKTKDEVMKNGNET